MKTTPQDSPTPQDMPRWLWDARRHPVGHRTFRFRRAALASILAMLAMLGAGMLAAPAQAGPQCSPQIWCGTASNQSLQGKPPYNMGIGILYNAWSNYGYDAVVYPNQSSTAYAPDFDKVWAGSGWCVQMWDNRYLTSPTYTVKGPGWSPNISDAWAPYRMYAYPCSGSW